MRALVGHLPVKAAKVCGRVRIRAAPVRARAGRAREAAREDARGRKGRSCCPGPAVPAPSARPPSARPHHRSPWSTPHARPAGAAHLVRTLTPGGASARRPRPAAGTPATARPAGQPPGRQARRREPGRGPPTSLIAPTPAARTEDAAGRASARALTVRVTHHQECGEAPLCGPSPFRTTPHGLLGRAGSAAAVMLVMLGLGAHLFARRRPAAASDPSRPRWHQGAMATGASSGYIIDVIRKPLGRPRRSTATIHRASDNTIM